MAISIKERKEKRKELLLEIYNHYFENKGAAFKVIKDSSKVDSETKLAYDYLAEKGLITIEKIGNQGLYMKPTAFGIDFIEND